MNTVLRRCARAVAATALLLVAGLTQAQPFAYISGQNGSIVSVLDTATNTVVTTIPVGGAPFGIGILPSGTRAYVANSTPNTVSVINLATNTVFTTIGVGSGPSGVAVNPAGTRVYVANLISNSVSVIDTSTNGVINTVPVSQAYGMAINPAGTRLYVTNPGLNQVSIIDTGTNSVTGTIGVSGGPGSFGVAFNPSGTLAYVANEFGPGSVSVIDTSANTVIATIPLGVNSGAVAVNPAGTRVYTANGSGNSVSVIDTATNAVITTIPVGIDPRSVAFNATGTRAYVGNVGSNTVSVIDTGTNTVLTSVTVLQGPFGIAVAPAITATVPGAPTIGTATAGVGSATVSYTPPASDGGSPITTYTATSSPGGNTGVATGGPIIVGGLTPGTPYTFTVTATNIVGTSLPSAASNSVTPTAPPPFIAVVTNTADSGPGSLRQAMIDTVPITNACAPSAAINFNIPGGGPHVIAPLTALPTLFCANTLIDGYSQPGATPNTIPNALGGSNAVIKIVVDGGPGAIASHGVEIRSSTSSVRGLSVVGFTSGAGIFAGSGASTSDIAGNFLGVLPNGTPKANKNGVSVAEIDILVGGAAPVARNVVACNTSEGIEVSGSGMAIIENNEIGNLPNGATGCGNGTGVAFKFGAGSLGSIGAGNFIRNNSGDGVFVDSADNVSIIANVITNNGANGILFGSGSDCASVGVRISRNSIGTQGGQGIELLPLGRDVNDPLDADGGGCSAEGNNGQNYPTIDKVTYRPDKTLLDFTLSSEPSKTYDIEIYTNATPDITDRGRGETLQASTSITTGAAGTNSVALLQIAAGPNAPNLSMLAIGQLSGDTSEFSRPYITPMSFAPLAGFAAFTTVTGTPVTNTVVFTNITSQPLNNVAPTISPAGNFTILSETCSVAAIAPAGTCTVVVRYNSATASTDAAALTVAVPVAVNPITGANTSYQLPLSGTATAVGGPVFSPSATLLAFPPQVIGTTSAPLVLTITNLGAASLSFSSVATSTSYATDFVPPVAPPLLTEVQGSATSGNDAGIAAKLSMGMRSFKAPAVAVSLSRSSIKPLAVVAQGVFNSACSGLPLAPAAACDVNVTFTPAVLGSNPGTLTIATTAPGSPHVISLTGTGIAATTPSMTVGFAPASVAVGVSTAMTLTLSNPDISPAFISGGSITIPAGLVATPPASNTCGTFGSVGAGVYSFGMGSIPAQGSCTIILTVQGAAPGTYTATILPGALTAGAGASSNSSIAALTVTPALAPAVTLSPPGPLGFGTRTVNTTSPPTPVTLTNSGTANLVIASITGSGDYGFTTTCPLSTPPLAPAGTCTINITFTPLTVASLTGSITITSNAPGSPHTISLSGTGSAVPVPGLAVSASSLNFGSQRLGASSSAQTVVVTNTGFGTLLLTGITATSPFSRLNIGPAQGDCGTSLAPGLTCQIAVVFTPTVIGSATGQLSIASNASANPFVVSLSGSGAAVSLPQIQLGRALDFGDQVINTTASLPLIIGNTGGADLTISGITLAGTNAGSFATSGSCATIPANASCTLTVNFTPASTGGKAATLTIASNSGPVGNAASAGSIVNLSGNGIFAPRPVAQLSITGLGFGNTIFGGATPSQLITLTNIGGVAMSVASILTTGDYIQTNSCGATLNPNANCVINVLFSPLGLGNRNGELQVFTNADGSPHRVQLSGTGCRWFSQPLSRFFLTACGG